MFAILVSFVLERAVRTRVGTRGARALHAMSYGAVQKDMPTGDAITGHHPRPLQLHVCVGNAVGPGLHARL